MIYFIQAGRGGPIKVGSTIDVRKRLRTLQTASPYPLRLLATLDGGAAIERQLHDALRFARLQGEWFRPKPVRAIMAARKVMPSAASPKKTSYRAEHEPTSVQKLIRDGCRAVERRANEARIPLGEVLDLAGISPQTFAKALWGAHKRVDAGVVVLREAEIALDLIERERAA